MVLEKISLSDALRGVLLHRGTRTFSVSSGNASLDSFSFRLSLEDRFHRTPAETPCVDSTVHREDPSEDASFHRGW